MPRKKRTAKQLINEFALAFFVAAAIQWHKKGSGASVGSILAAAFPAALGAVIGLHLDAFAKWKYCLLFLGAFALCVLVQWRQLQHGAAWGDVLPVALVMALGVTLGGMLLASLWRNAEGEIEQQ